MDELTRATVDSEHYVARYVRGGLDESQLEAFEEFCLLHPDVAEQVATDRALVRGLRGLELKRKPAVAAPWVKYALAAGVATAVIGIGYWGYSRSVGVASAALYAADTKLPEVVAARISGDALLVVLQRGATIDIDGTSARSAIPLNVVLDSATEARTATVVLIEYVKDGEVELGRVTQPLSRIDDELIAAVVLDLSVVKGSRLRLDVTAGDYIQQYQLRVVR